MQDFWVQLLRLLNHKDFNAIVVTVGVLTIVAIAYAIIRIFQAGVNLVHRHRCRRRISKAVDSLEKSVSAAIVETTAYQAALQGFIRQYNTDRSALLPAFEAFKLQITRFSLPKIDPTKLTSIKDLCYVNQDPGAHYRTFYHAVMLGKSCSLYREFFAQDNWRHLATIETLIGSLYHSSSLKAHAEYLLEKVPDRDADQAMLYFSTYARMIDEALDQTTALHADLKRLKPQNTYWWILSLGA